MFALQKNEMYSDQIAKNLNKPRSTIAKKLKELESVGVVEANTEIGKMGRRIRKYTIKNVQLGINTLFDYLNNLKSTPKADPKV